MNVASGRGVKGAFQVGRRRLGIHARAAVSRTGMALAAEVTNRIDGDDQEQETGNAQKEQRGRVDPHPTVEGRLGRVEPDPGHKRGVDRRGGNQQAAAQTVPGQDKSRHGSQGGNE